VERSYRAFIRATNVRLRLALKHVDRQAASLGFSLARAALDAMSSAPLRSPAATCTMPIVSVVSGNVA